MLTGVAGLWHTTFLSFSARLDRNPEAPGGQSCAVLVYPGAAGLVSSVSSCRFRVSTSRDLLDVTMTRGFRAAFRESAVSADATRPELHVVAHCR